MSKVDLSIAEALSMEMVIHHNGKVFYPQHMYDALKTERDELAAKAVHAELSLAVYDSESTSEYWLRWYPPTTGAVE